MSVFTDLNTQLNGVLDGTEDVNDIILIWKDINEARRLLEATEEKTKTKIKNYLKERQWDNYRDDKTDISVRLIVEQRTSLDKEMLSSIISESQMKQITRITTFEKLSIITPERRKELNKIVRPKKKK